MTNYSWEDFADIFNLNLEDSNSLGRDTDKCYCRLELTLNYPRTAAFLRLTAAEQQVLYIGLFDYVKLRLQPASLMQNELYFETSLDGTVHAHGYIDLSLTAGFSVEGLVMGLVRDYFDQLPKRSCLWLARSRYSHNFSTFKSPPILVQYISKTDKIRTELWAEYCKKDIKK